MNPNCIARGAISSSYSKVSFHVFRSAILPGATFNGKPSSARRNLSISSTLSQEMPREALATGTSHKNVQPGSWKWKYLGESVKINHVTHSISATPPKKKILLLPAFSDVSTVEEWSDIAASLAAGGNEVIVVDWPGFGESDRPPFDYTADLFEQFLVDFFSASDSPLAKKSAVVIGAGHAATAVARATVKGLLNPYPEAIIAVAPTWGGPLPIVFGKSEKMEGRYALLRNSLRLPGIGWALYRFGLTSEKNMKTQYLTHVYSRKENVSDDLITKRTELTRRDGARFAPASFVSGRLDAVSSRDEFLKLFEGLEEKKVPVFVLGSENGPKRSKAEMQALEGAKGVSGFKWVPGALLPHEEFPQAVASELLSFVAAL